MPALGKEIERQLTPDEIALKEIQGYIDRAERQAEIQQPQSNRPQPTAPAPQVLPLSSTKGVAGIAPATQVKKIVLPLNQIEVETGLRRNIMEGVRWLSEWCVMMIKKYPGRVFYMSQNTTK
ncbi:hypothetical protein A3K29_00475 [Candidatus Collierbacteria bacterium RIFOXYB2_FULL_46_14]|uniref:Uncharacterized protein n=1 Tax=Candidatus Collierbacteria bacterium GW2011_GWA2_46_26 TaxID=1618381 RepID=A0A0G1RUM6_9BACT|nr:MAG: hypothetical protein UW29_C0001G0071 [Candidatus Collierbacteria bacterium GW2011_GWC2_44_13]KKU33663.1 MAG: hypothetical protein UX47_C0002G0071 [Candidatus Collierbacteria bacterium GW2011_GWA2_46_26]OGD72611.1 MAG: hypothetical protein A3K29_00475 [Candidatus Collierbacteria bacterium RIFOXYB2_FULL_46_14]OGD75653.1 MAG: hypothetical protein A3K43_00475 [Candidatus Collierbacteria bacterium RIFOXYA2_FULL_46_20]OGD76989.1 MAG: hypothetical protein A3K39_00475 [Candidatus Collierbacteri